MPGVTDSPIAIPSNSHYMVDFEGFDKDTCKDGKKQSPIDFPFAQENSLVRDKALKLTPMVNEVDGSDTGHSLMWKPKSGAGSVTVDGVAYNFLQMHAHYGSEHTFSGDRSALELHFVHLSEDGGLAVVGVLCREQADVSDASLPNHAAFFTSLKSVGAESTLDVPAFFESIDMNKYYTYSGSLTTPACNEGVKWHVMATECVVPKDFMNYVRTFPSMNGNYRDVMPIGDRQIFGAVDPNKADGKEGKGVVVGYAVKSKIKPDEKMLTSLKNAAAKSFKDSKVTAIVTKNVVLKVKMPAEIDSVAKAEEKLKKLFEGKKITVEESSARRFLKEFLATVEGLLQDDDPKKIISQGDKTITATVEEESYIVDLQVTLPKGTNADEAVKSMNADLKAVVESDENLLTYKEATVKTDDVEEPSSSGLSSGVLVVIIALAVLVVTR